MKSRPQKDKKSNSEFWIEGEHACLEQLKQGASQVQELFFRDEKAQRSLLSKTSDHGTSTLKQTLDSKLDVAVKCLVQIKTVDIDSFVESEAFSNQPLIFALDHVQDPRNLGAIVRSAAFFGIGTVLTPVDRQVSITQAAVATAQGGFACTQIVTCTNLARTLVDLKENHGYWVAGLDGDGEKLSERSFDFDKLVVVLGSEGPGLSRNIKSKSDVLVSIPRGAFGFDSLNVSVAAGIAMFNASKNFSN